MSLLEVLASGKPLEMFPEVFTIGDVLMMEQECKYEWYMPFSVIFTMFGKGKPDDYNPYRFSEPVEATWDQIKHVLAGKNTQNRGAKR